jgi:hypothetical protein
MNFKAIIKPNSGLYQGAEFVFRIEVPPSYPYDPPKATCETLVRKSFTLIHIHLTFFLHRKAFLFFWVERILTFLTKRLPHTHFAFCLLNILFRVRI